MRILFKKEKSFYLLVFSPKENTSAKKDGGKIVYAYKMIETIQNRAKISSTIINIYKKN